MSASARTDAVFALCSKLAAEAIAAGARSWRPTVSLLKTHGIRGNQTDIQDDIHAWVQESFKARLDQDAGTAPGVPVEFVNAFLGFVEVARNIAHQELDADRQIMASEIAAAKESVEVANKQRDDALRLADDTGQKLDVAEAVAVELRQQVSDLKATVIAREGQLSTLNEVMANTRAEQAARIAEFEAATNLAQERYEAMERKLLLEIDSVRVREHAFQDQLKEMKGKLEGAYLLEKGMERRASSAENLLAELRGRFEGLETRYAELQQRHKALAKVSGKPLIRSGGVKRRSLR